MPYSTPVPAPAPLPVHSTGRPGHRRSYTTSSFTQERGPGAFAPLGALPRRRSGQPSKKTVFHLSHEDDDDDSRDEPHDADDDDVLHNIPPALKLNPNNSFRLSISTAPDDDDDDDSSPTPLRTKQPSPRTSPIKATASVPFPRSSPLSPPIVPLPPPNSGATSSVQNAPRPNVTRTTSTPILLSNGKPLKSSLKSSSSSPHISFPPQSLVPSTQPQGHLRARSAPSTPNIDHPVHKNVHFPSNEEGGLATVRIFNRSAKPASLSRPSGEDTETETEGELSTGSNSGFIRGSSAVFPFPRSPLGQDKSVKYEVDPTASSLIPAQNPAPYANVYLESLTYNAALPGASSKVPPGLSGTLLVRNIAYEKQVAVRFTLDDWQTTSEVSARHFVSLPTLPSAFLASQQLTYGDIAAQPAPPTTANPQWDRFSFHIKLEDYAFNLAQRTLYLVVRYNANTATGPLESWDNNLGSNYKIAFREATKPHQQSNPPAPVPNPRGRVFAVSSPPSFAPATTSKPMTVPTTTQPQHAQMVAQTTLLRLKKLNLRNYAAPGSTVVPSPATATSPNVNDLSSVGGSEAQSQGRIVQGRVPANIDTEAKRIVKEDESESESESESEEEDIKTPTGLRSRTSLPPGIEQDPAVRRSGSPIKAPRSPPLPVPLLSFSSSSASSSASSTPPTGGSSPQLDMGMNMDMLTPGSVDIHRPSVLSPLEMGTSPPFSMLADLGPSLAKRKDAHPLSPFYRTASSTPTATTTPTITSTPTPTADVKDKEDKEQKQEGYWPWDGKERSEEEVRKVLAGIREKSTSSPVRRVSPSGRTSPTKAGGGGRSSPLKQAATVEGRSSPVKDGRASPVKRDAEGATAVVSPQPRMPDWSRVGSGWNKTPTAAAATVAPRASPIYLNATSTNTTAMTTVTSSSATTASSSSAGQDDQPYTPPYTPPVNANGSASANHQDSVYQAFVRQWCFAQGPSPVPSHGHGHATRYGHGHGHGRNGREGEGVGGGQLVV